MLHSRQAPGRDFHKHDYPPNDYFLFREPFRERQ